MTVAYRDAGPADAAAVDTLFDTVFREAFGHLYRPEDLDAFLSRLDLENWATLLGDPACSFRIAEADGSPAAYVKLGPLNLPVETTQPALLLEQLYVLRGLHGTGVAAALMDWAIARARERGASELYLTVFVDNQRARRFYDRYGFEAVGRYDFKVGSQVDEDIIMVKRL
jgi:GNAT superfamily N-acetyltransferase